MSGQVSLDRFLEVRKEEVREKKPLERKEAKPRIH